MYRDASHLWHSFSHNINIQFLNNEIGHEVHYLIECKIFDVECERYLGNYFCKT